MKIFDCSNSSERPMNRHFGGPFQNEFVGYLKEFSKDFGCEFVEDYKKSDLIFTNDVFPKHLSKIDLPKVKRMDGVFWQESLKERNEKYNLAAQMADHVIFISEYSSNSYQKLYGNDLKELSVVKHWTKKHFEFDNSSDFNRTFFCMATDWARPEKRFDEVLKFSKMFPECSIKVVGKCESTVPKNVELYGYLDPDSNAFLNVLKSCTGMLNLTCKDAATKTVCISINHSIPVLYSNSGGVSEYVQNSGEAIFENDSIEFLDHIPKLQEKDISEGFYKFKENYNKKEFPKTNFENSLSGYFEVFKKYF